MILPLQQLGQWWPTNMLPLKMEVHVHMIGNLDERYPLVHAVVLAVEHHLTGMNGLR